MRTEGMDRLVDPITCIPHREPALIVEGISVDADTGVECRFTVRDGTHYVEDGFLCVGGLVEAMAQAAAAHLGIEQAAGTPPSPGLLVGLEDVRLSRLPRTGERIRIRCGVSEHFGPSVWLRAEAWAGDESIATGILKVFTPESSGETG